MFRAGVGEEILADLEAVVRLGQALHLGIVAEGIEPAPKPPNSPCSAAPQVRPLTAATVETHLTETGMIRE